MNTDIFPELDYFLSSFFIGILFLFCYDAFRIARRLMNHTWLFIALEDIFFWAVAGIIAFRIVYEKNFGIIRAYAFGAMIFGMWIYFKFVSGHYVRAVSCLIKRTGHTIYRFFCRITYPIRFVVLKVKKILDKIKGVFQRRLEKQREKQKLIKLEQQRMQEIKNKKKLAEKAKKRREKEKMRAARQKKHKKNSDSKELGEAAPKQKRELELIKK